MSTLSILEYLRDLLATIAPATSIKTDDALVVMIDAGIQDAALLGFIQRADEDSQEGIAIARAAGPELQRALDARGIDLQTFLAALPTILALVQQFRKRSSVGSLGL